jgi:hypothetical protein
MTNYTDRYIQDPKNKNASMPNPNYIKPENRPNFKDVDKNLRAFAIGMAQSTARSGGTLAVESYNFLQRLLNKPENQQISVSLDKNTIGGKVQRAIFGEEPLTNFEGEGKKVAETLSGFGVNKNISSKIGTPLAVLSIALDFTGLGGEKNALKKIVSTKTIDGAETVLKNLGVSDDIVKTYSKAVVESKNIKEAQTLLDSISNLEKTTKVTEGIAKTPKFLESVSKARPEINLKVAGQYIPRSTDELATKARNLILDNINKAEEVAKGTDDNAIATASELIKHYGDEALKATDQSIKNIFLDKASDIAHTTAATLTNEGRAVQAASIIGRLTPEGQLRFAAKEINKWNEAIDNGQTFFGMRKKIPQLTSEQSNYILTEGKRIQDMPDGIEKAMDFKKLQDYISNLVPSTLYQKVAGVWKAGLLTGIKTSGLNTVANLFHGVSETAKDIPAVAIDSVSSLFTGKRTIGFSLGNTTGIKEGFEKGYKYLRTGYDERNSLSKLDYNKINFGSGKLAKTIQTYEESIFKLMGAEDQPFYYGAKARSISSQAIAEASNRGLKGQEAKNLINDLIDNPTNKMIRTAVADAEIAVFQNETTLGKLAKAIQNVSGGQFIVPFARTPAAVAMQLVNYSPLGAAKTIFETIKSGKFDQKIFSQGMGRALTGTAIMGIGAKLAEDGLINTSYPATEREQKLWELEGRTPNSIKIGDKYRNLNILGPAGYDLIAGANYYNKLKETGSPYEALAFTTMGGMKSLSDQTFLQGINQITTALNNPDRFEGFFANTVSSIIPTIVGDVAKGIDQTERKSTGVFQKLQAKVPFLRSSLQPVTNVLGKEKKTGNFFEVLADPSRPSNVLSNPVIDEFRRLKDAGFPASPTLLGDKNGYKALTPEQNTALWEKTGELTNSKLSNLIIRKEYQSLKDDEKSKIIGTIISKAEIVTRAEAVLELTQGLSGETLKKKLSDLKKGGLLTREVFDKYTILK